MVVGRAALCFPFLQHFKRIDRNCRDFHKNLDAV
jgi:hypothetical protein